MKGQKRTENILYLVLWVVLFVAPVISMYMRSLMSPGVNFDWMGVVGSWQLLLMFCITFAIHNFFLAPILIYKQKKWQYFGIVAILIIGFQLYQCNVRPHGPEPIEEDMQFEQLDGSVKKELPPPPKPDEKFMDIHRKEPPKAFGEMDMVAFVIMMLLLGLNVGTKYFFKSLDDRKRMRELEQQNLRQQLEYLKYQINPHFFMNTLNNIHALVDIDAERAKTTIEVLSKLMRYVLYDSNRLLVPLKKEIEFIQNYIDLMRIRFTERLRISVTFPEMIPECTMAPPLLFITFVENAFKHGVSFKCQSFIEVGILVEDENIVFTCQNSRKPSDADRHGGVGIRNVEKRLKLIYGGNYKLMTIPKENEFTVKLIIPKTNKNAIYDYENKMSCN